MSAHSRPTANPLRKQRESATGACVGVGSRQMVRLHLLGKLALEADGAEVDLASLSRKARLLLAVLAIERRVHGRSELAGRLWPDVREDSARVSLRTALSQVRAGLGPAATSVLVGGRDGGVSLAEAVRTDLDEVVRLLDAGHAGAALERCAGELLPGLDDDWALEQRNELRERLADGLAGEERGRGGGELNRAVELAAGLSHSIRSPRTPHGSSSGVSRARATGVPRSPPTSATGSGSRTNCTSPHRLPPASSSRRSAAMTRLTRPAQPRGFAPPDVQGRCVGRDPDSRRSIESGPARSAASCGSPCSPVTPGSGRPGSRLSCVRPLARAEPPSCWVAATRTASFPTSRSRRR